MKKISLYTWWHAAPKGHLSIYENSKVGPKKGTKEQGAKEQGDDFQVSLIEYKLDPRGSGSGNDCGVHNNDLGRVT